MNRRVLINLCTCFALFLLVGGTGHAQGQTCGGFGGLKCPAGEACQYPFGQCNTADLSGVCVKVPAECPQGGPPVCGCDGKTYKNECELLKAGAKPDKKGACGGGVSCKTNADCAATDFCEFKAGACRQPGKCEVRPELCTQVFSPVCGCDNKTYANDCQRKAAGVSLLHTGECKKP